jgi:cytochrome P450
MVCVPMAYHYPFECLTTMLGSFFLTTDFDLHKRRRLPYDQFFARKSVEALQPKIAEIAHHLETRLSEFQGTNKVVRLEHVFFAFVGDIITRICFANENNETFLLNLPDFGKDW